jgi:hypothetical protein
LQPRLPCRNLGRQLTVAIRSPSFRLVPHTQNLLKLYRPSWLAQDIPLTSGKSGPTVI